MKVFKSKVKELIEHKDFEGLDMMLSGDPRLANEGITIPFDVLCRVKAHPLHRICDGVFSGRITDSEAVEFAKIFLNNGADINGYKEKYEATPLLAAASLHAEETGILYIEKGADVHYTFRNDGATALHWAAYCGLDKLVNALIQSKAKLDIPDITHASTPLGWAIHALQSGDSQTMKNQENCVKLLLEGGANAKKLDEGKYNFLISLAECNSEVKYLLD